MKPKWKTSPEGEMIIPPFSGVRLVEYADHIALTPMYSCREFVGLGKIKASQVRPKRTGYLSSAVFDVWGDKEIWVVMRWERYEDGREEPTMMNLLDGTEAEAHKEFNRMVDFCNMSKQELEELGACLAEDNEDRDYVKHRFPDEQPSARSLEEYDLYQARLKVLAGMQPKTVTLIEQAYSAEDPAQRKKLEGEAVAAFFAELSHYWTEVEVKAWQRSNPIGTEWISEFTDTLRGPVRSVDKVDHALVLDWLRKGYNLLTAEELSEAVYKVTGQRLKPDAVKKRRERLGLTTKRPPGPRPKSEV